MSKKKATKENINVSPKGKQVAAGSTGINSMANWFAVLLLVLPLMISREAMDPTITIRYLALGIFTLLFAVYFYGIKKSSVIVAGLPRIVFILAAGYLFWSLLAGFNAVNRPAAFYEELRFMLQMIVLFLFMQVTTKEADKLFLLCQVMVIQAFLQSFIGICQFYGVAFTELPGANVIPYGLMANRNLFGSAEALLLPFAVYVFYKGSKTWKWISGISISFLVIALVLSQTRSAWLASLAMIAVSFVLVLIFSPRLRKRWMVATGGFLLLAAVLASFVVATDKEGNMAASVKERALGLAKAVSDTSESSANANERLKIWKKTAELINDRPMLGAGPANWKLVIPSYGTKGLVWSEGTFVPDRVHNIYLQTAAETGFPGLLLLLATWIMITVIGLMVVKRTTNDDRRVLATLMIAGIAGFAVDGMFSFPLERIEHSLYLSMMGGVILGLYAINHPADMVKEKKLNTIFLVIMLVSAMLNIIMGYKKHQFEVHMNYAKAYEADKRYQDVLDEVAKGKNDWVNVDQVGITLEAKSSVAYRELKNYDQAIAESRRSLQYNPNSSMVYNNLGTVYTNLKENGKAIEAYQKALAIAPDFDIVLKNLSVNYFAAGNYKASAEALQRIRTLDDPYLVNLLKEARRLSDSTGVDSLKK